RGGQKALPEAALVVGDVELPHVGDGSHGIWAQTNARLALVLASIEPKCVGRYVDEHATMFAGRRGAGRNGTLSEGARRQVAAELWLYLSNLASVSESAADAGLGLVFVKMESW